MNNLTKIGYIILLIGLLLFLNKFIPIAINSATAITTNGGNGFSSIISKVIWILTNPPGWFILAGGILLVIGKKININSSLEEGKNENKDEVNIITKIGIIITGVVWLTFFISGSLSIIDSLWKLPFSTILIMNIIGPILSIVGTLIPLGSKSGTRNNTIFIVSIIVLILSILFWGFIYLISGLRV